MRAVLQEGRKALPDCLPNPPVGCVLVKAGQIIACAYDTVEPCSFHGRNPSCTKALTNNTEPRQRHATFGPVMSRMLYLT